MLSMYMLYHYPGESPNEVMAKVQRLRPEAQFFETAGKYPPLAEVVRLWRGWLLSRSVPDDAKAKFVRTSSSSSAGWH